MPQKCLNMELWIPSHRILRSMCEPKEEEAEPYVEKTNQTSDDYYISFSATIMMMTELSMNLSRKHRMHSEVSFYCLCQPLAFESSKHFRTHCAYSTSVGTNLKMMMLIRFVGKFVYDVVTCTLLITTGVTRDLAIFMEMQCSISFYLLVCLQELPANSMQNVVLNYIQIFTAN